MSAPEHKHEYPPLLPIGRHLLSLNGLRALCVDPFPLSATRPRIMAGLEKIVQQLVAAGIVAELWIDGSFLTEKVDPEDVDASLRIASEMWDNASEEQRRTLEWLVSADLKITYACDMYLWIEYPEGHPDYWVGQYWQAYWMRQWGFSRSQEFKGIAVLRLPEGAS